MPKHDLGFLLRLPILSGLLTLRRSDDDGALNTGRPGNGLLAPRTLAMTVGNGNFSLDTPLLTNTPLTRSLLIARVVFARFAGCGLTGAPRPGAGGRAHHPP
ncbi:hypothetical protein [Deinococcus planocerae]|uniref:hypothetical protein n=1 Tax=Deinococcus planocerae TaxID=1737569 RepID=UPI0011AF3C63|nr:hypothetical protein [Deinococcus planocerae]